MSGNRNSIEYLYGLTHDLGKAYTRWQDIIHEAPYKEKPPHAMTGAAIFFSIVKKHFSDINSRLVVELTLDILGHHGLLKDFAFDIWNEELIKEQLNNMDLDGISDFLYKNAGVTISLDDVNLDDWGNYVQQALKFAYKELKKNSKSNSNDWLFEQVSKSFLEKLVEADRVDAAGFAYVGKLEKKDIVRAIDSIKGFCEDQEDTPLNRARQYCQKEAVNTVRETIEHVLFKLNLPTGYGKTITALRVALEACLLAGLSRIIYIAPYINVLSQSTKVIKDVTGVNEVLEHHHLSFLREDNAKYTATEKILVFDVWHEKIITSTFNKIFEAVFPKRANDLLRRSGMKNAFIILDEPQIVDYRDWELFLGSLEKFARDNNSKILLCTATCPNTKTVLRNDPVDLVEDVPKPKDRYMIHFNKEVFTKETLAQKVLNEKYKSLGVVLDTIRDAYEVFDEIRGETKKKLYFLSGLMNSHHKAGVINNIRTDLEAGIELIVVSTQMLELGMDLSFKKIIRALSTIPSIIQTAGRVNRQGKDELGELEVVIFQRENGSSGRNNVYPKALCRATDRLLPETLPEGETDTLIERFYQELSATTNTAWKSLLQSMIRTGNWKEIRDKSLFKDEGLGYSVFVPYPRKPQSYAKIMDEFGFEDADSIYDFYLAGNWKKFDYVTKKKFFSLLMSFTVSLKFDEAINVTRNAEDGVLRLIDDQLYCPVTGLSFLRAKDGLSSLLMI